MATDGETKVEDYGIFTDAISTVNNFNKNIKTEYTSLKKNITAIDDDGVFAGPAAESIVSESEVIRENIKHSYGNFKTMGKKLDVISANYEAGDDAASRQILAIKDGKVGIQKVAAYIKTGNQVQDDAYAYLRNKQFSDAAICGIFANIEHESGFNLDIDGDYGQSHGLCQWYAGRNTELRNYCKEHNLEVNSVEGQLEYMMYELKNKDRFKEVYKTIQNAPNTPEGAYQVADVWCKVFEVPEDANRKAIARGQAAQSKYWDIYGQQ